MQTKKLAYFNYLAAFFILIHVTSVESIVNVKSIPLAGGAKHAQS